MTKVLEPYAILPVVFVRQSRKTSRHVETIMVEITQEELAMIADGGISEQLVDWAKDVLKVGR